MTPSAPKSWAIRSRIGPRAAARLLLGVGLLGLELVGDLLLQLEEARPRPERVEEALGAQRVLRPRLQLARGERLRQVVVRERLEALQEVLFLGPRRHEEHLRVGRLRERLDPAADLVPREVVHPHVEKDDVRRPLGHLLEGLGARKGALEVAVELFGDVGRDLRLERVVVDEEDERPGGAWAKHRNGRYPSPGRGRQGDCGAVLSRRECRTVSLRLFDTAARSLVDFQPLAPGHVGLYTCGPTVYNRVHIGNLRTFVWEDVMCRAFRSLGFSVTQVMNLTDIDDKTIRGAVAEGLPLREFTDRHIATFFEDLKTLNVVPAAVYPRATDHIPEMVEIVKKLTERGHTYESDGTIWFRIASFPSYGKLSRVDLSSMKRGARVADDEYEKEDVRDFAVWKGAKEGEPESALWETELGKGRPGWHLECSAMSMKYLGETLDIHTGRRRQRLPAPRERDRPERGGDGEAVREDVAPRRAPDRRRREDGEVEGELLHAPRRPRARLLAPGDPLPAPLGPLPAEAELHLRRPPRRRLGGRAARVARRPARRARRRRRTPEPRRRSRRSSPRRGPP